MKTNNHMFLLVVCLVASVVASGCSKHIATAPSGTWTANNGETIEFLKDGSFSLTNLPPNKVTGAQIVSELRGTYTMVDSTHLKLEVATSTAKVSFTCQYSVSGSELILQESGQEAKTFRHANN